MPLDQIDIDNPSGDKEMGFLDHLEELRWHLIRSISAILILTIVAFFSKDFIFGVLILGPSKPEFWTYRIFCQLSVYFNTPDLCIDHLNFTLQSRQMTGQFAMHITSSFVVGFILAFPYVFWELWRFVKPGLYVKEVNATRGAVFVVTFLFALGILFGYFVISPLSINFLANYQLDPSILNQFDITSYISTLIMMVLASGLMFQLPMIVFVLTKMGLVTPQFMRTYRKHSIVVILIVAAFITPSPDIFSQLLVAIPIYLLYEVSIYVSAWELRAKNLRNAEFLK
ncbi:MAG: twin-arginine translocase subunit TatC [Cytophagales bacterium]